MFAISSLGGSFPTSTLVTTNIAATGGWQVWTTLSTAVNLSAGSQTVRLLASAGGWNINWFEISNTSATRAIASKTSAAQELETQGINVYPNPAQHRLNITVEDDEQISNIDIVDMTGKAVMLNLNLTGQNTSLDISELPRGIYMLRLDVSTQNARFVK